MKTSVLTLVFLAFGLLIVGTAFTFRSAEARFGPFVIGIPLLLLLIFQVARENLVKKQPLPKAKTGESTEESAGTFKDTLGVYAKMAITLLSLLAAIYLLGIVLGFAVFIITYLKIHEEKWRTALIAGIGAPAFFYILFELLLHMNLYKGLFLSL